MKNYVKVLFGVLCFILITTMVSCGDNQYSESGESNEKSKEKSYRKVDYEFTWNTKEYAIVEERVDSCEYIVIFGVDGRNIIHKANCDNPYHLKN